ncbi:MAG: CotH kinase family protein [Bacteroidales bacterium]|nr:CotH kinase family protein [Candidatus Physcousia equi]
MKHGLWLCAMMLLALTGCKQANKEGSTEQSIEQDENYDKLIVINEVMAENRTGLLDSHGVPSDWVELKNLSDAEVDLTGYTLMVTSEKKQKKGEKKKQKQGAKQGETTDSIQTDSLKTKEWTLPSVKMAPGECLLIFASKHGEGKLNAPLKLHKNFSTLRLLTPQHKVCSEVTLRQLLADEAWARQEDGSYEHTHRQSPGRDNTLRGYEDFCDECEAQRHSPLLIWEVMSRADKTEHNWVELKNVSDSTINLEEYCLDRELADSMWTLPKRKLQPGECFSVQTVGKSARRANATHAKFKLKDDETVVLARNGQFVDGVCAKQTTFGTSIGRAKVGGGFCYFASPTRDMDNQGIHRRHIGSQPIPDKQAGIYANDSTLTLHLDAEGRKIHYTLDGSLPTESSPVYHDALLLNKSTVVRAFAESTDDLLASPVLTATYLLGTTHTLPVVSIAIAPADMYSQSEGIYVNGPGWTQKWPHLGANYWKAWKKHAHVELFDGKDGFSTDCGFKIFGGFSRAEDKKSFCVKFNNQYGKARVTYDYFDNGTPLELKDIVLRSGSQDWMRCMIRDEFFTSLMAPECPTMLTQPYRPVALYVNAEYFGLYYIREKIDKHFVSRRLQVSTDSISILMSKAYREEGSAKDFEQLHAFVSSNDMSKKENYEHVKGRIDLQGLIDQKIGEIYSANTDVGNIRYVRSTDEGCDQRWHFVFYDLDASWVGYMPAAFYLRTHGKAQEMNVTYHNSMVNSLLRNKAFRQLFLERLAHHLTVTFTPEHANAVLDRLVEEIRPEMRRNCERWQQLSYETWEKNIDKFRVKFSTRQRQMLDDLRQELAITPEEEKQYFGKLKLPPAPDSEETKKKK